MRQGGLLPDCGVWDLQLHLWVNQLRNFWAMVKTNIDSAAQRAVNHMTLDGSTRVRMELPSSFEMASLLSMLDERRGKFNIRARQSWGTLYTLDLNETYRFLEELSRGDNHSQYDLSDFIDHRILKSNKWVKCIKESDPTEETFVSLFYSGNLTSSTQTNE
jgi:hypothetical protein